MSECGVEEAVRVLLSRHGYKTGDLWRNLSAALCLSDHTNLPQPLLVALFFASVDTPWEPRWEVKRTSLRRLYDLHDTRVLYGSSLFLCTFNYREYFATSAIDDLASEVNTRAAIVRALQMLDDAAAMVRIDGLALLAEHLDEMEEIEYQHLRKRAAQLLLDEDDGVSSRAETIFRVERRPVTGEAGDTDREWLQRLSRLETVVIPGHETGTRIDAWRALHQSDPLLAMASCTLLTSDPDTVVREMAKRRLAEWDPLVAESLSE